VTAFVLLSGIALSSPAAIARAEDAKPVLVVNPQVPVTVQGTAQVAGQVTVTGTVEVTNEPIVRLRNPTVSVGNLVRVDPVERIPSDRLFRRGPLHVLANPFQGSDAFDVVNPVPAGKVFVVSFVSVQAWGAPQTDPAVAINVLDEAGQVVEVHYVVLHHAGSAFEDQQTFFASQPLKLYALPGQKVVAELTVSRAGSAGDRRADAAINVSGYFLPAE